MQQGVGELVVVCVQVVHVLVVDHDKPGDQPPLYHNEVVLISINEFIIAILKIKKITYKPMLKFFGSKRNDAPAQIFILSTTISHSSSI